MVHLLAAILGAAPPPGTYVFEGGFGTLVLEKKTFAIDVTGANAHVCSIKGAWSGKTGVANDEGSRCDVTFEFTNGAVKVEAPDTEDCRAYCGARASFDGTYLVPPKGCARAEVKRTRDRFKAQFDKKEFAAAVTTLSPLLDTCTRVIDRFGLMWIRNDLALAQHRAGDDAACLATLEPLAEYRDAPLGEPLGSEPAFEEELARIAKATRTNAKLCGFVKK